MNIIDVAKVIDKYKMSEFQSVIVAIEAVNEELPEYLHIRDELTGRQVVSRVKHLPKTFFDDVIAIKVFDDDDYKGIYEEVRQHKRNKKALCRVSDDKKYPMALLIVISLLVLVSLFYVSFYFIKTDFTDMLLSFFN